MLIDQLEFEAARNSVHDIEQMIHPVKLLLQEFASLSGDEYSHFSQPFYAALIDKNDAGHVRKGPAHLPANGADHGTFAADHTKAHPGEIGGQAHADIARPDGQFDLLLINDLDSAHMAPEIGRKISAAFG